MSSTARTLGGIVAGLLLLLMFGLINRQYRMWSLTRDGYYLVSTGIYLVVAVVFYAGTTWGFTSGEQAERIFAGGAGLMTSIAFLAAAYFWFTGRIFGDDRMAIFSALVWTLTAVVLAIVSVIIIKVAQKPRENGS